MIENIALLVFIMACGVTLVSLFLGWWFDHYMDKDYSDDSKSDTI